MSQTEAGPTRFDELVGHTRELQTLERVFASGRPHHAYLLTGPAGIGKRSIARILARSLLCRAGRPGYPCNRCPECQRTLARSHPDFLELTPDGAFIKIDVVRQLIHSFALRPFEGGSRVAIIDPAERMTDEAANALLKTLEEPPRRSTFLLVAANAAQLLPTIVSRCQLLPLSPLAEAEVAEVLKRLGVDATEAAIRYSGGSPGRAVALLEDDAFNRRNELFPQLLALEQPGDAAVLAFGDWAEPPDASSAEAGGKLAQQRDRTRAVLDLLKVLVRDLMLLRAGGAKVGLVNGDLADRLAGVASTLSWRRLTAILDGLREAEQAVEGNVTPRLVLENLAGRVAAA